MSNRVRNGLDNLSVDLAQFRLSEWSSCHPLIRSNKRFSFTRVFSATATNVTLIFTIWCRPLQQIGLGIGSGCVGSTRFFTRMVRITGRAFTQTMTHGSLYLALYIVSLSVSQIRIFILLNYALSSVSHFQYILLFGGVRVDLISFLPAGFLTEIQWSVKRFICNGLWVEVYTNVLSVTFAGKNSQQAVVASSTSGGEKTRWYSKHFMI